MTHRLRALLHCLACSRAPAGGLAVRRFVQAGASVSLICDDRRALRAAGLACCCYRSTAPAPSGWAVTVRSTRSLSAAGYVFAGAPRVEVGAGVDARVLESAQGVTFWVDRHATLVHTTRADATVEAYCARPAAARYWSPRLVGQAMAVQLRAGGAVDAHAGAAVIDGTGVLIAGRRGSGTTTTLLTGLRLLRADLVADDRLLLRREADELLGHPWPMHLRLGMGTLRAFPELTGLLGAPDPRPGCRGRELTVEPPELGWLLAGGTVTGHVRPRLMLWPRLALDAPSAPPPEPVPAAEVRQTLLATRLFMTDPDTGVSAHLDDRVIQGLPADAPRPVSGSLRDVVDTLVATVPCYRVAVTGNPRTLAAQITTLVHPPVPSLGS